MHLKFKIKTFNFLSLQISAEVKDLIGEVDELFSQKDKEREEISFSPFSISDDDDREPLL